MRKLSIFSWFGFSIPMEVRLKMIKDAGFDGVLLWWGDENIDVDGPKAVQPELARRNGLFIENVHTPFEGINSIWLDNLDGMDFEKKLLDCIINCSEYGIPTAIVHISQTIAPPPVNNIGLDRIRRLVDTAERLSVNIALENLRRPDYLDFVFSNIQSQRLGFCYDSGHENCYSKGTDLLTKYGSKLMALHLHDNDESDDQHVIPGEGTIDWEALVAKLDETGYSGMIALEVRNEFSKIEKKNDSEIFLKHAFDAAKKLACHV